MRSTPSWAMFAILAASAGLAGCSSEPAPEPEPPARRPPQPACEQARSVLERQGRGGRILFEDDGEAMIEQREWERMSAAARDELVDRLAVLAGCSAATPRREVEITIRSEAGGVLVQRTVSPSTDFIAR